MEVLCQAPVEAIQSGQTLPHLLRTILHAKLRRGTVFMSKIDLLDAYLRVWIHLDGLLGLAFFILLYPLDQDTLIGFHLSFPMGYVDSAPYFLCASKTSADLSNHSWYSAANSQRHPHPLLVLTYNPPDTDYDAHSA